MLTHTWAKQDSQRTASAGMSRSISRSTRTSVPRRSGVAEVQRSAAAAALRRTLALLCSKHASSRRATAAVAAAPMRCTCCGTASAVDGCAWCCLMKGSEHAWPVSVLARGGEALLPV